MFGNRPRDRRRIELPLSRIHSIFFLFSRYVVFAIRVLLLLLLLLLPDALFKLTHIVRRYL